MTVLHRALPPLLLAALLSGCAATRDLGKTERLPEGTLPAAKEVGPPVNIQPAPLGRDDQLPPVRARPFGGCWPGDPFCAPFWRPGIGIGYGRGLGWGAGIHWRLF
jgi:hypothetical protein